MLIRTRAEAVGAASTHAATIVYYNVSNSAWIWHFTFELSFMNARTELGVLSTDVFGTYAA